MLIHFSPVHNLTPRFSEIQLKYHNIYAKVSQVVFSLKILRLNFARIPRRHACYMHFPSNVPRIRHPNNIWWRV